MPETYPDLLDRQLELLRKCFEIVSPLGESLEATERLAQMAKKIGLRSDSGQILKNYQDFLAGATPNTPVRSVSFEEEMPPMPEDDFSPFASYEDEFMPTMEEMNEMHQTFEPLSKTERTLLQELVQHPNCLMRKEISELLEFIGSEEVKRYILRLKELVYEIDDSEYASVVANITRGAGYSDELIQITSIALAKFSPLPLEEKTVDRLLFDINKKLQEDKLKMQKNELKMKKSDCNTQEEMNTLMLELLDIDKKLNAIKNLKPSKK